MKFKPSATWTLHYKSIVLKKKKDQLTELVYQQSVLAKCPLFCRIQEWLLPISKSSCLNFRSACSDLYHALRHNMPVLSGHCCVLLYGRVSKGLETTKFKNLIG